MNGESSRIGTGKQPSRSGFRISGGPVISDRAATPMFEHGELPASYGAPILFAIPRDPQTIFSYWNINWSDIFARRQPIDRQVYLRLKRNDGTDEVEEPVEPMLGTHFVMATRPKGEYQVELGFYNPADTWNPVATSDWVTMPADRSSDNSDIDLATVPFHLSFQRMIDLFRRANGEAVTPLVSRLQERAADAEESNAALTPEEQEILRAMDLSIGDIAEARRKFSGRSIDDLLRKRAEALLGFGGTSPSGSPGGSSWMSAGS